MTVGELKAMLAHCKSDDKVQLWLPGTRIEIVGVSRYMAGLTLIEGNVAGAEIARIDLTRE